MVVLVAGEVVPHSFGARCCGAGGGCDAQLCTPTNVSVQGEPLQPYPDPELLSCRAPESCGGKAGKKTVGPASWTPKHYKIPVRLSDDPWPLGIMGHAETGYPGGKEDLDFPFFCCCILCAAGECSWLELKAAPPTFSRSSVWPRQDLGLC